MKKNVKRGLIAASTIVVVGYVLVLVGVWGMQDRLMFGRRTSVIAEKPSDRNWSYEDVWVEVAGGKTHGWWIPAPDARGTVLFSHGSGRNVSGYLEDAALFRELGLSVLMYDYGGYGLSSGSPSEQRCYADGRAMWDHLVQVRKIAPREIILIGSSMGSGITTDLAAQVFPGGMVLESAFTSVPATVSSTYPFIPADWLCHIQFRNIDKIGRIHCPVLIIHSKDDTVVPFEHGQQLYHCANSPKMFVEIHGAHYGGKFASRDIYLDGLRKFLIK